jgi:single-stranded DNA-binding protein
VRNFAGTGVITRLAAREITKNGEPLVIATMSVDVKDRVKINGQWDNYHTCLRLDLSGFGGTAKFWMEHLKEGEAIEVVGALRQESFEKRDGTKGYKLVLEGLDGGSPLVKWLPKGFDPKPKEEQPAPDVSGSQEPPF